MVAAQIAGDPGWRSHRCPITLRLMSAITGSAVEPPPQLAGVNWKVTSFNNNRHAVVGVIGEPSISMSFKDGQVSGSAGCNMFHGTYATDGGQIKVGPLATTRRACDEPLMIQEREFLAALASAVTWSIDGNVLDMHRADGERAIWAVAD